VRLYESTVQSWGWRIQQTISELKKDKERYYRLVLRYFVFLDRELEREAEMKLSEETNDE
jgi:hypothetical protein